MNEKTEAVILMEREIVTLRRLLWASHGHNKYLYGDDGEMQCHMCGIDFKRHSIGKIEEALTESGLYEAAKEAMHSQGFPWTDPRTKLVHLPPPAPRYEYSDDGLDMDKSEIVAGIGNRWYILHKGSDYLGWSGSRWVSCTTQGLPAPPDNTQVCNFATEAEALEYIKEKMRSEQTGV